MSENRDMSLDRNPLKHHLSIYGPAALLVVAAFVLAFQFIKPAPPDHVVIASGGVDGAYYAFAKRYAEYLAREGITLEVRATNGSVENLALLGSGEVSLALVQGGVGGGASAPALTSLGSVYYEPLWLFHRRDLEMKRLSDLAGARLAVGPQGSGTRALASRLLADNGIVEQAAWADLGGEGAVDALLAGEVDAAFFVISANSDAVRRLLTDPRITLADFTRSEAYGRRYRFLRHLELPEGVVDLAANIPDRTVHLLATSANLVSHPDLHPAVVDLMLLAATEVHKEGGLFEAQDEFPMPGLLAFPLNKEAERFYENGPPFLQRFLPFWAASLLDRLKVMLLPLLVLMFPLIKVMPPIYTWRMRARVYRWYDELELAEQRAGAGEIDDQAYFQELDRIEAEVRLVKVPLSFTDQLFNLRQHIELLRRQATR